MYVKIVKKGNKKYKYYYHNIKQEGKVKNIFLSNNKKEALIKLKALKSKQTINYELLRNAPAPHSLLNLNYNSKTLLDSAPSPVPEKGFNLPLITLLLVFGIGLGILYFILQPSITGFTVYNTNLANINNLAVKFKIKELLGILIGLELMVLSYNIIYKDHLNKK